MDTDALLEEYALLLDDLEYEHKRTKFFRMYPPEDRVPNALGKSYAKHIEAIALTKTKQFVSLIGGNGCITPWTLIETAVGSVPILECLGVEAFAVRSWDGERRCAAVAHGVYLKSIEPAFRIHLDNGRWFDCTRKHRVLTSEGWHTLDQLVHGANGLRWSRTDQGSPASCGADGRQGDEQPPSVQGIGQGELPSTGDAQQQPRFDERPDATERRPSHTHAYQGFGRPPSSTDDLAQVLDLCAQYEDPSASLDALWCSRTRQALQQLAIASGQNQVSTESPARLGQSVCGVSLAEPLRRSGEGCDQPVSCSVLDRQLSVQRYARGQLRLEPQDDSAGSWIFCPYDHVSLIGGNRIVSVEPIGFQPILDLTVANTSCYESAGVFHHNSGKSIWGAVNDTAHATGLYPDWWPGHKFNKPIDGMVAGRSWGDVEKSIQEYLLGKPDDRGTGMIPGDLILGYGPQIPNTRCVEHVRVKHVSGLTSYIYFKSYEQPVLSFEMTNRDYIRLDEEPDFARYAACVQRFRGHTKGGRLLLTFTPEKGATEVVQLFLPEHSNHITPEEYEKSSRGVVVVSQYDVPHKSDEEIEIGALNMDARRRAAKVHGVISAGEGAVYQVEEERFVVDPFPIPDSWPRVWICDPGYDPDPTAVIWAAHDRENGCWYLYREHYLARQPVSVHATAIKLSGDWIPGLFDTQANAVSALSGDHTLLKEYRTHWPAEYRHQLDVVHKIGIEDSVIVVGEWLATGQLKVFSSLKHWLREYRGYRRDEKQKIVDKNNHCMDVTRYLITGGGINAAKTKPRDNRPTVTSHEFGKQWT